MNNLKCYMQFTTGKNLFNIKSGINLDSIENYYNFNAFQILSDYNIIISKKTKSVIFFYFNIPGVGNFGSYFMRKKDNLIGQYNEQNKFYQHTLDFDKYSESVIKDYLLNK